jgi:hypothetical protein
MALGEEAGRKTAADVNQYVLGWLAALRLLAADLLAELKRHRIAIQIEEKEK